MLNARFSVTKLLLKKAQLLVKTMTPAPQRLQLPEKQFALPKRILARLKPMSVAVWLASNNCKLSWDKQSFGLQSVELWQKKFLGLGMSPTRRRKYLPLFVTASWNFKRR